MQDKKEVHECCLGALGTWHLALGLFLSFLCGCVGFRNRHRVSGRVINAGKKLRSALFAAR